MKKIVFIQKIVANEKGAVLPFAVLIIIGIVIFIAFVVNTGILASTTEQSKHFARFALLAGIEEYYDTSSCTPNCDLNERYNAALDRINNVFAKNYLSGAAGQEANPVQAFDSSNLPANAPVFLPGTWYPRKIYDPNNNEIDPPCGSAPCFQALTADEFRNEAIRPNAFRLAGNLYSASPVRFAYAMLGQEGDWQYPVRVTATLVPRRGCIMVDISSSMVRETHNLWNYNATQYSEWFNNQQIDYGPHTNGVAGFGNEFAFRFDYSYCNNLDEPLSNWLGKPHCGRYYWMTRKKSERGTNTFSDIEHYADDYVPLFALNDNDYIYYAYNNNHPDPFLQNQFSAEGQRKQYAIDSYFLINNDYSGPEPLASVFAGLQSAIRTFKSRQVMGDKMCLVFYDQSLQWPRMLKITENFEALIDYTRLDDLDDNGDRINPNIVGDNDPYTVADAREGFYRVARHALFPSENSFTNTLSALKWATNELARAQDEDPMPSSDFLVLIGDGLTNCVTCDYVLPEDRPSCLSAVNRCFNNYNKHQDSLAEINQFITEEVQPRNIPIHFMLVGQEVVPNHKIILDANGKCISTREAYSYTSIQNHDLVAGGVLPAGSVDNDIGTPIDSLNETQKNLAFLGMAGQRYRQVNLDSVQLTRRTGGLWAPIRRSPAGCQQIETEGECGLSQGQIITTDPKCRDVEEQLKDYFNEILSVNPYSIVEVN